MYFSPKQRTPAYTDRILWQENSKEVATLEQTTYTSHMTYTSSDHKPISAEFNLQIPVRSLLDPCLKINKDTRAIWEICSKSTIKIPEPRR